MSKIPLGKVGKIVGGNETGRLVKVIDDSANTGGFLILTSKDELGTAWFDNWVRREEDLERYFKESRWLIEWVTEQR